MSKLFEQIDKFQKEINSHRPFDKNLFSQIKEYYKIGLTYSSNAIEGNSLTESETKVVIEDGLTIGGKPLKDHYEALGHSEAYDFIYKVCGKKEISEDQIKKLHHLFYNRIDSNNAGQYRNVKAYISGSKYPLPLPENIANMMKAFIRILPDLRKKYHPVEFSAIAHKEFVFIHPFIDGNGRVARLLMNLILLQEGYNIAIIPPAIRSNYIAALEKAHEDQSEFIELIANAVLETQKDYIRLFEKNAGPQ